MMASCKEASRLASDSLNRRLTLGERIALRTHLFMCEACRRFERQITFLHHAASRIEAAETAGSLALSPSARDRINRGIRQGSKSARRPSRRK